MRTMLLPDFHKAGIRPTAALLTPVGRGAVATIQIIVERSLSSGDVSAAGINAISSLNKSSIELIDPLFRSTSGRLLSELPISAIAFGHWGKVDVEDLVVCRTSTTTWEIHCHGGESAAQRILNDLSLANCEIVDWREQAAKSNDIIDSECLEVLSRTTTWKTTEIALEQSSGLLGAAFRRLKTITPENEAELQRSLNDLLKWAELGLHLATPFSVVLTGLPNVGKSSLINALLGYERAIVFDQPGTTRDVITGETAFDGWPVVLADTAGIRDDAGELEAAGIALARCKLANADLRLVLIDVSQFPTDEDFQLLAQWPDALIVAHKCDLPDQWNDRRPESAINVSSVTGEGLLELQRRLIDRLIVEIPPSGTPIPVTSRQIELLRAAHDATAVKEKQPLIERLFDRSS